MAKAKEKKKEIPATLWVRIKADCKLSAGSHKVGKFPNKVGTDSHKILSRDWTEVDGTWGTHLKESALSGKFEFSTKNPNPKPKTK